RSEGCVRIEALGCALPGVLIRLGGQAALRLPSSLGVRLGARDCCTDLLHIQLDDGAVIALLVLEAALLQVPLGDDSLALTQVLTDVLSKLAPRTRAHEESLAVHPFVIRPDAR